MELPLSRGMVTLLDDEDYDWLSEWSWSAMRDSKTGTFYARRGIKTDDGRRTSLSMHVLILSPVPGYQVDHRNGDGLDNQRSNLRLATKAQNLANQRMPKNNTSGYKGVGEYRPGRFTAQVASKYLGCFSTALEAARAYDEAALERWESSRG